MFLRNGSSPASPWAKTLGTLTMAIKATAIKIVRNRLSIACLPSWVLGAIELSASLDFAQTRHSFHTSRTFLGSPFGTRGVKILSVYSDRLVSILFCRRPQHHYPITDEADQS